MSDSQTNSVEDPCAEFGPVQRNAIIWFVFVVIGGGILVSQLARIDSWMFENNAETLDYGKYRENRVSQYSMGSDDVDPRSQGAMPSSSVQGQ